MVEVIVVGTVGEVLVGVVGSGVGTGVGWIGVGVVGSGGGTWVGLVVVVEAGMGCCSISDDVAGSNQSSKGRSVFITGGEAEIESSIPGN